jgi:hypothetical protein
MRVAIHQPHFLPWLGYPHRMAQVDLFVLLDHVQFERRNYQNRTMFRMNGETRWLTVPVVQRSQKERIIDKEIDNRLDGSTWWADLNQAALELLRRAFGIHTPLAGFGGSRGYLDTEAFARAGVEVASHQWEHPVYDQCGPQPFIKGLSAIDLLFNCGPQAPELLLGAVSVAKAA